MGYSTSQVAMVRKESTVRVRQRAQERALRIDDVETTNMPVAYPLASAAYF
jgi:hypothetical protein